MAETESLRIALVGCGQIADAHLGEIRKLAGASVVAVCDMERDLAVQAAARFEVPGVFTDLVQMLETARPNVVHITTPPHTHKPLALTALKGGAHVYVEKPFTVNLTDAQEVLAEARACGRLACVGHDHLFDPAWVECREMHVRGELGEIVHIESVQGYDLGGIFGRLVSSDQNHWVHRLPGGIFHNTISHAVYKITEFLPDESPGIWSSWSSSGSVKGTPGTELRVQMRGAATTATLISSCAARPVQRLARIHGTKLSIEVDLEARLIRRYRALSWPGPFAKIEEPLRQAREAKQSFRRAIRRFFQSDLQYLAGMAALFQLFYQRIREGGPPPIPYREILRVTSFMDAIFEDCLNPHPGRLAAPTGEAPSE
ncbi:MAG: Gfo/Idh/MocA family protein [Planctomycetales bacterium]